MTKGVASVLSRVMPLWEQNNHIVLERGMLGKLLMCAPSS